jgi:nitrogen-specific signal transduction histidine kinase
MLKDHLLVQERSPLTENDQSELNPILDYLPCAVALWRPDRSSCLLNNEARQLLGVAEETQPAAILGLNRIHPQDQAMVAEAWAKVQQGASKVSCEYRLLPHGGQPEILLQETAVPYTNMASGDKGTLSVYTKVLDRKAPRSEGRTAGRITDEKEILDGIAHELQNQLQSIGMGVDLLQLTHADPFECQTIQQGIDRASRLVREMREYFCPPESQVGFQSLAAVVTDIARKVQKQWSRQGVQLRVVCHDPLPPVRLDGQQMSKALERLLTCAYALRPTAGEEVVVEAGLRERGPQQYIEIEVRSRGLASLEQKESEIFTPFWRVNGYPVGLSLVLVRRFVGQHQGQITFQVSSANQGCFTLCLRSD